jgi:hypothetical protein
VKNPHKFQCTECAHKFRNRRKKTKTILEIDIPEKLRKEAAASIAESLTHIYRSCLKEGTYPNS